MIGEILAGCNVVKMTILPHQCAYVIILQLGREKHVYKYLLSALCTNYIKYGMSYFPMIKTGVPWMKHMTPTSEILYCTDVLPLDSLLHLRIDSDTRVACARGW